MDRIIHNFKIFESEKTDRAFKLTTSPLITVVSTVIPPIALIPIIEAPPISAGKLPEVARPSGRISCGGFSSS